MPSGLKRIHLDETESTGVVGIASNGSALKVIFISPLVLVQII